MNDLNNYQTLHLDYSRPNILVVTLNRPEVRNAINSVMMRELWQLWSSLYANPQQIRCIILTGQGDKAFCAGADLKERYQMDVITWQQQHASLQQAMLAMQNCNIPIIAAVNGIACGGGFELVLNADFAYAAQHAKFGLPETTVGIMPGAMGTQHLPRACGIRRAKELCFTGEFFSAEQALQWGVINKICHSEELFSTVLAVAAKICENAPLAVRQAKKSLNQSLHADIPSGYQFEVEAYNYLLNTADRIEGVSAFNEKRKAKFNGI